jgi:quinol monooxygenase YgiN
MLIVAGSISVAADRRSAYLDGCVEVLAAARAAEGCLDFAISPDPLDAGRINVYERWATREQLLTFRGAGPSDEQQADVLAASVEEYEVTSG